MTDGQFDVRPILMVLVIVAILLATTQAAMAKPRLDQNVTVVSSTVLGEDTFTMTAWNVSLEPIDIILYAPGVVADVTVDTGIFDGQWVIEDLGVDATATMVGVLES